MNISAQFKQQLASHGACGPCVISVASDRRQLRCTVQQCNPLAISFDELSVRTTELATAAMAELQRLSEKISARLTYLLEPISPIEADAQQCTVQMRSNPPQQDDDGRSYYELLVRRGGELNLVRYRKEPHGPRQRIPATVTSEVLCRLVNDLDGALDEFFAGK